MQFKRTLPGSGSTAFYLSDPEAGGLSTEQQLFTADLIMAYREKYPGLKINAVWDFAVEESDPVRGEKYGVFALSKDNAVYNAQMLTISINHARVREMPCKADPEEIRRIEEYYAGHADFTARYAARERELLSQGVPWPQIEGRIRDEMEIVPCTENKLSVADPYFADVQAIRMLENTQSIERLLIHEIGHMLSEESGAVDTKPVRKLFGKCRDGFENIYEFCAECFMASELTDRIRLANEYRQTIKWR